MLWLKLVLTHLFDLFLSFCFGIFGRTSPEAKIKHAHRVSRDHLYLFLLLSYLALPTIAQTQLQGLSALDSFLSFCWLSRRRSLVTSTPYPHGFA